MQGRHRAPLAFLASTLLALGACAPGASSAMRGNAYRQPAQQACVGERELRVQNGLTESVEILEQRRGSVSTVALLSPGLHRVPVAPGSEGTFAARTAGSSEYLSTTRAGKRNQDPNVRMEIQCRVSS